MFPKIVTRMYLNNKQSRLELFIVASLHITLTSQILRVFTRLRQVEKLSVDQHTVPFATLFR